MTFFGSSLSYPFRVDAQRGTLATTNDPEEIVAQSIIAILRTRKGERHAMPKLGIEDPVFGIVDVGYAVATAHDVVQQIRDYVPLAGDVRAEVWVGGDPFAENYRGEVGLSIYFTLRSTNSEFNLTFPSWDFNGVRLSG